MKPNAEILKFARRAYGCTQQRLADLVGCDRTYIGKIETGERPLTAQMERKIREALGLDEARMAEVYEVYLRFRAKSKAI